MSIFANPNPANVFLTMYDACILTNNEDFCKSSVAGAAPSLVNTYLSVYSGCRRVASPEICKDLMAPKSSPSPIIFGLIGVGIGWLLGKKL